MWWRVVFVVSGAGAWMAWAHGPERQAPNKHPSRKQGSFTGSCSSFAGIRNQGNTCYLNSLLQTLYHIGPFREAVLEAAKEAEPEVFATDLEEDKEEKKGLFRVFGRRKKRRPAPTTTTGALASVFASLNANATAETRHLTRALGVDPQEQQDAQEYLRLLLAEVAGGQWYEGAVEQYLKVTDEEAENIGSSLSKRRREKFLDLSLEVSGEAGDVAGALAEYFAPERLTGDLKWRTSDHGPRDALKGVELAALPPVLVLHLKRFAFDFDKNQVLKLLRPLKFPVDLDLAPILAPSHPTHPGGGKYRLHAVVCHVGTGIAGHYYAFVDPLCDGRWLRFDDHRVSTVHLDVVLAEGFGVSPRLSLGSAYLLQYVRHDAIPLLPGKQRTSTSSSSGGRGEQDSAASSGGTIPTPPAAGG